MNSVGGEKVELKRRIEKFLEAHEQGHSKMVHLRNIGSKIFHLSNCVRTRPATLNEVQSIVQN